ncbi:hypothetical protein [Paraflavitalea speifideaquila]|uniref:hypothetical protein n=1 Tax=Paraflavitalea speifideaquila TaxID=3076558 RepID=UPI0028E576B7|nr:hypothetical protein [Paraflavitalea speifideiaquila]
MPLLVPPGFIAGRFLFNENVCLQYETALLFSLFLYPMAILYARQPARAPRQVMERSNLEYVDPTIGNVGQLLEPTHPTIQLPNQMIRVAPQRKDYLDNQITSFPLNIVSRRLGQVFSIKPCIKPLSRESWQAKMAYDHDLRSTAPGIIART